MSKSVFYADLVCDLSGLITDEKNSIATLSNVSALLYQRLDNVNWVGFYLLDSTSLVLGPFQGNVACIRIPIGKGVCGSAFAQNKIERVADVHRFSGHIACDATSNAEIVLPMAVNGRLIGVLDIDSTQKQRFDHEDEKGLQAVVNVLCQHLALCDYEKIVTFS